MIALQISCIWTTCRLHLHLHLGLMGICNYMLMPFSIPYPVFFRWLSNLFLNWLTFLASVTCDGKLFQLGNTLCEKKNIHLSHFLHLNWVFISFLWGYFPVTIILSLTFISSSSITLRHTRIFFFLNISLIKIKKIINIYNVQSYFKVFIFLLK